MKIEKNFEIEQQCRIQAEWALNLTRPVQCTTCTRLLSTGPRCGRTQHTGLWPLLSHFTCTLQSASLLVSMTTCHVIHQPRHQTLNPGTRDA